ncbi:MAG: glucokinase [Desulfomonilaceae bacterium]|nr:glucokinase [Desulfomonilaceae bacterium]
MEDLGSKRFVLAGDVGGTKTNLGIAGLEDGRISLLVMETFPSREADSLKQIIGRFLEKQHLTVDAACIGIAGPVIAGVSRTTNLPWIVAEQDIRKRFNLSHVRLINDLAATAASIPLLSRDELCRLTEGEPEPEGNAGLMAPGTGLGIALMVFAEGRLHPVPSEGGHVDFAPKNDREMDLLKHLQAKMGRVSVERLASGPGLFTIYEWLKSTRSSLEPPWLSDRLQKEDPSKVISETGLAHRDPACEEALDMFVSIIGSAAGNLALTGLTTGGMYLGGGIAPKILPKLKEPVFLNSFTDKGRFTDLMKRIPLTVILNDKAALLGAARCAFQMGR